VETDDQWRAFCQLTGRPELLSDEQFCSRFEQLKHQESLDEIVSEWTRSHSKYETTEILQSIGIAAAPVLSRGEKFSDPELVAREDFNKVYHPVLGEEVLGANPWRLSLTKPEIQRPAPLVGEHNNYVYGELLNIPAWEIKILQVEKVIY
jgi:crotonobetainyl-CoA:carnitine CoA-transferase CaiB-like acyl-CoA transferase